MGRYLQARAGLAIEASRADLALDALTRRSAVLAQMAAVAAERDALRAEEPRPTPAR